MSETYLLFRHLFTALLLPPAPFLLMLLVVPMILKRWRRMAYVWGLLGIVLTWLSCTEAGAELSARGLLDRSAPLDLARFQAEAPDMRVHSAVWVLGGGIEQNHAEWSRAQLKPAAFQRLRYGLHLARELHLPVGFSGGPTMDDDLSVPESTVAQQVASEEFKLPLQWEEDQSFDTRDNARLSLPLLRTSGVKRIFLVTNAEHMQRSLRAFHQAEVHPGEFEIIPAPIGCRTRSGLRLRDWVPSEQGFQKMRYVMYERIGLWIGH